MNPITTNEDIRLFHQIDLFNLPEQHFFLYPSMDGASVRAFQTILARMVKFRKGLSILEWGTGGSTRFFSRYLTHLAFERPNWSWQWTAYDSNLERARWIQEHGGLADNVVFRGHSGECFSTAVKGLDRTSFDMILVLGEHPVPCMEEAAAWLQPGHPHLGFVLLHDPKGDCNMSARGWTGELLLGSSLWRGRPKQE